MQPGIQEKMVRVNWEWHDSYMLQDEWTKLNRDFINTKNTVQNKNLQALITRKNYSTCDVGKLK